MTSLWRLPLTRGARGFKSIRGSGRGRARQPIDPAAAALARFLWTCVFWLFALGLMNVWWRPRLPNSLELPTPPDARGVIDSLADGAIDMLERGQVLDPNGTPPGLAQIAEGVVDPGLSSLERLAEISKSSGRNHILYEGNAAGINIRALHQRRHAISRRQRAGGRLVLQGEEALCEADVATMEVLQAVEWKSTH